MSTDTTPGTMLSLSIDYSEDELDALADLFGVPALGSARLRRPPATGTEEAVRRATLATATRGLVARRAMMLTGTAIRPKVELLEPHATILRTFLGATMIVSLEQRTKDETDRCVVFVRDDVAVEQRALSGRAILRMTAHHAETGESLVLGLLDVDGAAEVAGDPIEISARTLDAPPGEAPSEAPQRVRDLLYARRQAIRATVVRHHEDGIERTVLEWLDGGTLGLWRVERDDAGVTARMSPTSTEEARGELREACGAGRVAR